MGLLFGVWYTKRYTPDRNASAEASSEIKTLSKKSLRALLLIAESNPLFWPTPAGRSRSAYQLILYSRGGLPLPSALDSLPQTRPILSKRSSLWLTSCTVSPSRLALSPPLLGSEER